MRYPVPQQQFQEPVGLTGAWEMLGKNNASVLRRFNSLPEPVTPGSQIWSQSGFCIRHTIIFLSDWGDRQVESKSSTHNWCSKIRSWVIFSQQQLDQLSCCLETEHVFGSQLLLIFSERLSAFSGLWHTVNYCKFAGNCLDLRCLVCNHSSVFSPVS